MRSKWSCILPRLQMDLHLRTFCYGDCVWSIEHSSSPSCSTSLLSHLFGGAAGAIKMAFSRSVTSLYRTSRALNTRGANPVNRIFGHERFGARAYAAAFQRDKPHVNIGMFMIKSHGLHGPILMLCRHNWPRRSRQDHPHSSHH